MSDPVTRGAVLHGARWRALLQVMQQLLSVLATVVLARLLSPADFGVAAAAMSMLAFFYLATAFGFGASIVRRTVVEESHLRSILAANLIAAFVLTIGGVLAAPLVARLIGDPHCLLGDCRNHAKHDHGGGGQRLGGFTATPAPIPSDVVTRHRRDRHIRRSGARARSIGIWLLVRRLGFSRDAAPAERGLRGAELDGDRVWRRRVGRSAKMGGSAVSSS